MDTGSTAAIDPDTSTSTSTSTTTGTADTTTGTTDTSTGEPSTSEGATEVCVPLAETCNGLDDDCDDIVDNVDVAADGFCDCLRIALMGNKGANPTAQFEAWLEMQGTKVDRIHTTEVPLDQATLNEYDIVLLDWLVRNYTAQEAMILKAWIEGGGGLISLTGFVSSNYVGDRPNTLIAPLGLGYSADKGFFDGPITLFADHPITESLSELVFGGGLYIKILPNNPGTAEVIMAALPQGPVGVVQQQGDGRVFVFGDEWIEFDSEWAQFPELKEFWANTLRWLAPQNYCYKPQ
ncbi:MAG: hypothetical protein JNL82_01090 [Myxococcales bacterium]|nr:hypothetical protein [Myxococcales bacterium]